MTDAIRARATNARRFRRRLIALVGALAATAAIVAGVAFARTGAAAVGTGVVVIDTNLGYQGGQAAGTGMVLTKSGEILTNNHVIRGATSIHIVVPGTTRSYTAKVVGYDVTDDVAILKAAGASNLKTVSTSSAKLAIGQKVTAVGNAGGAERLVSARGSITGLRQSIVVRDDQGGSESLSGLIRTNANLQPGDSGGPLLNSAGKVIGMDTAASSGFTFRSSATVGFAIPITKALSVAKLIEAGNASTRVHIGSTAFLGIQVQATGSSSGVVVAGVIPGGPAESAGLSPGDIITAIDGHTVTTPTSLTSYLLTKRPSTTVALTIGDGLGASRTVNVTLGSGPPQ